MATPAAWFVPGNCFFTTEERIMVSERPRRIMNCDGAKVTVGAWEMKLYTIRPRLGTGMPKVFTRAMLDLEGVLAAQLEKTPGCARYIIHHQGVSDLYITLGIIGKGNELWLCSWTKPIQSNPWRKVNLNEDPVMCMWEAVVHSHALTALDMSRHPETDDPNLDMFFSEQLGLAR
jgi:hypothetical protein